MLILKSIDVWEKIELAIYNIKKTEDLEPILVDRLDSLVNHYNGNLARNNAYACLESLKMLNDSLSSNHFYVVRSIDKSLKEKLVSINTNIELLIKILIKEENDKRALKKDDVKVKDRLPNVGNDKSENIFTNKEIVYE